MLKLTRIFWPAAGGVRLTPPRTLSFSTIVGVASKLSLSAQSHSVQSVAISRTEPLKLSPATACFTVFLTGAAPPSSVMVRSTLMLIG
jgi:hypothetical protein